MRAGLFGCRPPRVSQNPKPNRGDKQFHIKPAVTPTSCRTQQSLGSARVSKKSSGSSMKTVEAQTCLVVSKKNWFPKYLEHDRESKELTSRQPELKTLFFVQREAPDQGFSPYPIPFSQKVRLSAGLGQKFVKKVWCTAAKKFFSFLLLLAGSVLQNALEGWPLPHPHSAFPRAAFFHKNFPLVLNEFILAVCHDMWLSPVEAGEPRSTHCRGRSIFHSTLM